MITVDLVVEDERWNALGLEAIAERAAGALAAELRLEDDFEAALLACDDARIAALNADFRQMDKPTNVLSWPSVEPSREGPGAVPELPDAEDGELGDIALAYDTCAREADDSGLTMAAHSAHLVIHGLLHLMGYDHETDEDAALMEGIETKTLARMGIADPYSHAGPGGS